MKLLGMTFTALIGLAAAGCSEQNSSPAPANGMVENKAAASAENPAGAAIMARAEMRDAQGQAKGSATVTRAGADLTVRLEASGMAAGTYAAHVHTTGACDPAKFESAGGHWNPANREHGKDNPAGSHKGDLDNLTVGADGRGTVEFTIQQAALRDGATALLDADGAAMMIHAKPDDYRTDPTGNAGDRIACGVFG